jgi:REP element-mobilizing transposase RayT
VGGEIYHVINRANSRLQIFHNDKDYKLFEDVLIEAKERIDINYMHKRKAPDPIYLFI